MAWNVIEKSENPESGTTYLVSVRSDSGNYNTMFGSYDGEKWTVADAYDRYTIESDDSDQVVAYMDLPNTVPNTTEPLNYGQYLVGISYGGSKRRRRMIGIFYKGVWSVGNMHNALELYPEDIHDIHVCELPQYDQNQRGVKQNKVMNRMKVTLIAHTPIPEKVVAASAKLCYSDTSAMNLMKGIDGEKAGDFVRMLASFGHESPIEHVSFTFGIEGVSRSLLAQITRHRLASFSVQSQRYVKQEQFEYITPPEIAADPEALQVYQASMQQAVDSYNRLADILEKRHYEDFLAQGLSEKAAHSKAEKKAIEDARFVLPNACETKMVMTMNARSLLNFFRMRCCNRAQWEIRALAKEMLRLCYEKAPTIFAKAGPSCCSGPCPEGKMTCGQCDKVRKEYSELKKEFK